MATDDFNRADEPLDDSVSWENRKGAWEVTGGEAGQPTTSINQSVAKFDNSGLSSADYFAQTKCISPTSTSGVYFGVIARQANYSTDDSDGYFGWIRASANTAYLYKRVSGSTILLDSGAVTINGSTPYLVRLETLNIDSDVSIKLKVDGVIIATKLDDSSPIIAKGSGGLTLNNASTTHRWDDYEQGDLGVSPSILPFMMVYQ